MWANAQRDGRLPNISGALCSTTQFGWRPILECCAVTLPRRKTRWNLRGCPKVTASRPKFTIFWKHVEEILLFNKFFSDCRCVP